MPQIVPLLFYFDDGRCGRVIEMLVAVPQAQPRFMGPPCRWRIMTPHTRSSAGQP